MLPFIKEAVTGLFSKPSTEAYPFKPVDAPAGYRGRIVFHADQCISCGMCERVCAGGAISTRSEETEEGTLYITYTSQDGEAVRLTVLDGDILYRGIYTEKTDTYYGISREESYKVLHFRNQRAEFPALWLLAAANGAALLCVLVLLVRSGKKRNTEEE